VWQRFMDASRFVFLDETGTATNMTRRYGRAPRGQRVVDAVPHGHWLTTTFVAGLRENGIVAPLVVDGPMRGEIFRAYVEQMLAPALSKGDVVVLDNLAAHKVRALRRRSEASERACCICRPTAPISTQSNSSFPSSKRFCAKQVRAARRRSGPLLETCSMSSRPRSAATTSGTADMSPSKSNPL
jgi:hypothetical protein